MARELGFHSANIIAAQWDGFANFVTENYAINSAYIVLLKKHFM